MRHCLATFIGCALLAHTAAAAEQFPYTAYVNADDVYVRSGPGQNYYPTTKLKVGEPVEVYRHDPGGWYAVRPPEGSFCWVAVRYLQIGRNGLAVVNGDRVVARVGSQFSDIRDVIQVRLERGEEVEVLDTKNLDTGDGGEKWAKVAPVAGEFRWVLGKFLDRSPPEATLLTDTARRNLLLAEREEKLPADDVAPERAAPEQVVRDNRREPLPPASAVRTVSNEVPVTARSAGGFRPVSRASSGATSRQPAVNDSQPAGRLASFEHDPSMDEPAGAAKRTVGNTVNAEAFQAEIEAIDLELSKMVTEEPTAWSFAELRTRAETAVSRAQNAIERGKARLVLGKIGRFEDIRQRYQTVAEVQSVTDRVNEDLAAEGPESPATGSQATVTARRDDARYDAVGRLMAVQSPRVGQPQFALVDSAGQLRTYLSPAPGVILRPYVGRQVGISGSRGFMAELNAQHLTAKRVTVLEQAAVR